MRALGRAELRRTRPLARGLLCAGLFALPSCAPAPAGPCAEAAAVYASAVEAVARSEGRASRLVVLRPDPAGRPREAPETASAELLDDYVAAQAALLETDCETALAREFELVDPRTLDRIFSAGAYAGWERFEETYSARGYWSLSGIGFAADESEALCMVAFHPGREGGSGNFVHLERRNGRWIVADLARAWRD